MRILRTACYKSLKNLAAICSTR